MTNSTDPIYNVAMHYPPKTIHLISSDEPPEKHRESSEQNAEYIREHFDKVKVPVTYQVYPLEYFEENVFSIAKMIVLAYKEDPVVGIVIDISAGRGTIRQAMSRAGEIAVEFIQKYFDESITFIYTIQSRNKPVIAYEVGKKFIPLQKDAELLSIVEKQMTQTGMARQLQWNNQSEVSKSLQRLIDLHLVEKIGHRTRKLTPIGKQVKDFIDSVS